MGQRMPDEVWSHPSIEIRPSEIEGLGLFATSRIAGGTVLIRLAGERVTTRDLDARVLEASVDPSLPYVDSLAVGEEEHLVLPHGSVAHYGNHSCDPNMWHIGTYEIGARREIRFGEELTVDYATHSAAPGFSMICRCGSAECRGVVTSEDWRIAALQLRYQGHWVEPLQRKIAALGTAT